MQSQAQQDHPLYRLGEVSERSEDGEGKRVRPLSHLR